MDSTFASCFRFQSGAPILNLTLFDAADVADLRLRKTVDSPMLVLLMNSRRVVFISFAVRTVDCPVCGISRIPQSAAGQSTVHSRAEIDCHSYYFSSLCSTCLL